MGSYVEGLRRILREELPGKESVRETRHFLKLPYLLASLLVEPLGCGNYGEGFGGIAIYAGPTKADRKTSLCIVDDRRRHIYKRAGFTLTKGLVSRARNYFHSTKADRVEFMA